MKEEAALEEETASTMESLAKGRSIGVFRCLNCFERVSPPRGAKTYKCPRCSFEWRVFWVSPDMPRIRGPVWEVNRRLAEEATNKKGR
jgi:DNA-directed RNA polymerase subunit RPC12/RpoP